MIDRFTLYAKGGEGGNGCSSFRRSRQNRRGVRDGWLFLLDSIEVLLRIFLNYLLVFVFLVILVEVH